MNTIYMDNNLEQEDEKKTDLVKTKEYEEFETGEIIFILKVAVTCKK